jgi:hypothetical protein
MVGGLAAAAALAAVLVLVGFGAGAGKRLDVVAQARAALSPPQEIVHMVVTDSAVARRGVRVPPPNTTEQWSAVDPPRWRLVQNMAPAGRQEFAYAHGEQLNYVAPRNALTIYRGFSDSGAPRTPRGCSPTTRSPDFARCSPRASCATSAR